MKCFICDKTEFHSMEKINPERELLVCKECGNVMYRVDEQDEKKLVEYYRGQYRKAPDINNLLTTQNKENYIKLFLDEFLKQTKESGKVLTVGDIGAATGYLCNMFKTMGHKVTGCELTTSYRRFSEHFYGIPLTEELESKHKYDLLILYHVLEHMSNPDEKLKKYVDLMSDDGRFLIACPEFFDVLEEASGSDISDFTHLFHKDHINIFSAQSIKNLFAKIGLVIVKEDHLQYGQTYLLRKATPAEITGKNAMTYEKCDDMVEKILRSKVAIDLYKERKFAEAATAWPKFPEAYIRLIMETHGKDPDEQAIIFDNIKTIVGDNHRVLRTLSLWLYQKQDYDNAIMMLDQLMKIRPGSDLHVWRGWCFEEKGNLYEAMKCYHRAWHADPRKWQEMMQRICNLVSKIPSWDERACHEAKEFMFKQSGFKPELKEALIAK